ncbi:MAG: hypothetical protein QOI11_827 [Candidatus Eremiobacteraeota bacterium]|jgi:hypothetical protein|nr:hypothetical protein [Candidatus Eremiobacteraeota bacterium]
MQTDPPPSPPIVHTEAKSYDAPIADMRDAFARSTPQTDEDRARARAFIDGKIEMIRRDPYLTDAEKTAAIADLEARFA